MATRNSNNYKICIVPESSYGVINKTLTTAGGAVFFDDILEWNYAPIVIDRAKKENMLYKAEDRNAIVGSLTTGTLHGDLTDTHEILLQTHFDDETSPYAYAIALPTTKSVNIYQLYLDSTGACTTYDVLLGCIINPLTFTGKVNEILQYSVTIEAASYLQEQANSSGTALTLEAGLPVTGIPFLFGNVTGAVGSGGLTKFNSFSLELRKTMADNALRFQNSLTKVNDYYTQVGGTFQYEGLWDTVNNSGQQVSRYNQTSASMSLNFINTAATWAFDILGVVSDTTRPDADRGMFMINETFDLTADSGESSPCTITVS